MKYLLYIFAVALMMVSCQGEKSKSSADQTSGHKIVIKEVLQASQYTYVKGDEDGKELWMAIPKADIKVGDTYYYETGMEMKNFNSKDLNRTFETVLFLEGLSKDPIKPKQQPQNLDPKDMSKMGTTPSKPNIAKQKISIVKENGCITIGELFKNKQKYNGKTVRVKAFVTKFNDAIMSKNWIHLQDGTEADGKFDLTATSSSLTVKAGDIVVLEGTVALDKDFGFGYYYELLLEDAVKK